MVEIRSQSLQLRRIPHRRNIHHLSAAVSKQRGHSGNRVAVTTVAFLWILVTLISFFSFRVETFVRAGDDNYAAQVDDADANNDDAAAAANGDDAAVEANDDNSSNSAYEYEQKQYQDTDDDTFHWNQNIGFDGVSVMPLSCIN